MFGPLANQSGCTWVTEFFSNGRRDDHFPLEFRKYVNRVDQHK
jgi:hypothetical protein